MVPQTITKFFWDTDPNELDVTKHERIIIPRVLNYGTLADWRWLALTYGKDRIRDTLKTSGRTSVRESITRLAQILFV